MNTIIGSGFYSSNLNSSEQNVLSSLSLGKDLNGVYDEILLVMTPLSNQAETYRSSINIRELL